MCLQVSIILSFGVPPHLVDGPESNKWVTHKVEKYTQYMQRENINNLLEQFHYERL